MIHRSVARNDAVFTGGIDIRIAPYDHFARLPVQHGGDFAFAADRADHQIIRAGIARGERDPRRSFFNQRKIIDCARRLPVIRNLIGHAIGREPFGCAVFLRRIRARQQKPSIVREGGGIDLRVYQPVRHIKGLIRKIRIFQKRGAQPCGVAAAARRIGQGVRSVRLIEAHPYRYRQPRRVRRRPDIARAARGFRNRARFARHGHAHACERLRAALRRRGHQHIGQQIRALRRYGGFVFPRIGVQAAPVGGLDFSNQVSAHGGSAVCQRAVGGAQLGGGNAVRHGAQRQRKIYILRVQRQMKPLHIFAQTAHADLIRQIDRRGVQGTRYRFAQRNRAVKTAARVAGGIAALENALFIHQ